MSISTRHSFAAAVAAALTLTPVVGATPDRIGSYNFAYQLSGHARVRPVQVFDDGRNTFFQFGAGESIPAIFSVSDGRVNLLVPSFEGPYVKVGEVAGRYSLQLGRAQAQVYYGGTGRDVAPVPAAAAPRPGYPADPTAQLVAGLAPSGLVAAVPPPASPRNGLEDNSYATPLRGDRVVWGDGSILAEEKAVSFAKGSYKLSPAALRELKAMLDSAKRASRITIVGRDDDSFKEGLEQARAQAIRAELLRAGVPAERIYLKSGVQVGSGSAWLSHLRFETVVPSLIGSTRQLEDRLTSRATTAAVPEVRPLPKPEVPAIAIESPEVPKDGFVIKAADGTISVTLARWAEQTKYRLVWDAPAEADAKVLGAATISATSMKEAIEKVVDGLRAKNYKVVATFYNNRVIRFTGEGT